ncbi:catalase [Dyella acidisoli]|uniref:Catalase n=1 Tax=Dyella acidisoli TaxID=1867834 RepID=A0ABQ5XTD7_9GAMM|nr:catalase [Dyella acidisoli]GLQ93604.1 catalase [Dyella acidisoli]
MHNHRRLPLWGAFVLLGFTALTAGIQAQTTLTRDNGAPVGDNQNSQTAGPEGPTLLQDAQLVEKLQHFGRERIPERVVHARGTGAHGEFVSAGNFSDLTSAALFSAPGKKTPVFVRFSTVIHPSGSPETLRDPRGFATKFYTEHGNWDLVGNDLPVFFIRDAIKFPDMVHSLKPSPITNQQDPNRYFDFFSHVPEATHMLTWVYTDNGTPASYRTMDGFGVHAFKFVNAKGEVHYVKFHWKSEQGIKNLDAKQAEMVQGKDFNNLTHDLYDAIADKNYPKWDLYVQVLKPEDLAKFPFDPLDATKVWPNVPEVKLGTMTLDRAPQNFFQETEEAAFAPVRMVPGIEASEDRLLQGRLFSYVDTQTYRLGVNNQQLPINRPLASAKNYNQDGMMNAGSTNSDVNYQPSETQGAYADDARYKASRLPLSGTTQQERIRRTMNFQQAGDLYRSLSAMDKDHLISNLAGDLGQVKSTKVRDTMLSYFYKADTDYGTRLSKAVGADPATIERLARAL